MSTATPIPTGAPISGMNSRNAHAGNQLTPFHQQVDRDDDHEKDIDQRSQRAAQDAEDRPQDGRADPAGPAGQTQLERNARTIDRVLQGFDEGDGARFQIGQLLGLADQRRRHECDQAGDQADDDDVQQKHGDRPPALEDGQHLHPVDHRCQKQGDDRGENEQEQDVEQVPDEELGLVIEHRHRERDQQINQDPDGALEVAPGPRQVSTLFVARHQASLADRPPGTSGDPISCGGLANGGEAWSREPYSVPPNRPT